MSSFTPLCDIISYMSNKIYYVVTQVTQVWNSTLVSDCSIMGDILDRPFLEEYAYKLCGRRELTRSHTELCSCSFGNQVSEQVTSTCVVLYEI